MARVKRRKDCVRVTFTADEADRLAQLARGVSLLLAPAEAPPVDPLEAALGVSGAPVAESDDPAVRRLLPDAYADAEAAGEFRRLTDADLRARKTAALDRVAAEATSGGALDLDPPTVDVWLQALTDIRLVLGSRLDITDDDSDLGAHIGADDPRLPLLLVYDWLTWLQDALVQAVTDPG